MNRAYFVADAYNRALIFEPDFHKLRNLLADEFMFTGSITTTSKPDKIDFRSFTDKSGRKVFITKLKSMELTEYMEEMLGKSFENVCSTDIRSVGYTVINPYEVIINLDCQQYRLGEGLGEDGRGFYNIKAETKLTLTRDGNIVGIDQPVYEKMKLTE